MKNRNSPQLRMFKNVIPELPPAIAFRLTGKKSNRDAIGAGITIETGLGRQTRFVQAGSVDFWRNTVRNCFSAWVRQKGPFMPPFAGPAGCVQNLSDLPFNHRVWVEEGCRLRASSLLRNRLVHLPQQSLKLPTSEIVPNAIETWFSRRSRLLSFRFAAKMDSCTRSLRAVGNLCLFAFFLLRQAALKLS